MPDGAEQIVLFCFCVEGEFRCNRESVRWLIDKPGNHYTYFSKIETELTDEQCLKKAHYAAGVLERAGAPRLHQKRPFFREFALRVPGDVGAVIERGLSRGILAGVPLRRLDPGFEDGLLVAVTERRTREEIDRLGALMAESKAGTAACVEAG